MIDTSEPIVPLSYGVPIVPMFPQNVSSNDKIVMIENVDQVDQAFTPNLNSGL
jgi:hypothetical protein